MKKIRLLSTLTAVVLVSILCLGGAAGAKVLKYAYANAPNSTVGRFASTFSDLVKKETNGEITIQLYPSSQLGSKDEMTDGIIMGSIEMGHSDFAAFARLYDDIAVFGLPYLYRDISHAAKATSMSSPLIQKMNKVMIEKNGLRIIGNMYYGTRNLTCKSAIYKPEDLKNKKIRAVPIPTAIALVEGMGAIPTPVDFAELPTALATGIVDGQENPLTTIYNHKFYQVQKFLMLTKHMKAMLPLVINEKAWQGLTEAQQEAILKSADKSMQVNLERGLAEEDDLAEKLKDAGMTIIAEKDGLQVKAFRERVLKTCEKKFPEWKGYIDEIQKVQ